MVIKFSKYKSGILCGPWPSFSYICMINEGKLQELKQKFDQVFSNPPVSSIKIPINFPGYNREKMKLQAWSVLSTIFSDYIEKTNTYPDFFIAGEDFLWLIKFICKNYEEYSEKIEINRGSEILGEMRGGLVGGAPWYTIYVIRTKDYPKDLMIVSGIAQNGSDLIQANERYKLLKS